ncbi:MAG: glycosyltransferase [Myxococcales bacterium]|nr:glycosyltransferase [Myxococcales bacterium]
MTQRPRVSVVIPVWNGKESLPELRARLAKALDASTAAYELLFVDDGSVDGSFALIETLARDHGTVRGISLLRNYGQHAALLAGVRHARYEIVVTMDDDLQHRPEDVPALIQALDDDDVDLVYGVSKNDEHGLFRNVASRITKASMASAVGQDMARAATAFRAFRRELRAAFEGASDPFVSLDVLLSWATTRIAVRETAMAPRKHGRSGYTFRALVRHALNMLTGYSLVPLRLVTTMGFGLALFGVIVLAFVLIRYFVSGSTIPGFPFLASIVALFAGAQLFALGVLGEYLGRMHFRSMQRPAYAIRKVVGDRREGEAPDAADR